MQVFPTRFSEVLVIEPKIFKDRRGHFLESYQFEKYSEYGIPSFVQDNLSYSESKVLRGLHYQLNKPQGKLVWILEGVIYDVVVDIRKDSPTFGKWDGTILTSEHNQQLYVPKGFAHGFCVMRGPAFVLYKCSDYYAPKEERGIYWDDPSLKINWPILSPILCSRDEAFPCLGDVPEEELLSMEDKI